MAESAQIEKVSPKHEAILNMLITNPQMTRGEIARQMGVSQSWLSVVINSDVFQARLRERQEEFFSLATEGIRSKLTRLAETSLDRLNEIIPVERDVTNLRDAAKLALDGLGLGKPSGPAPATQIGNTTVNFIGVSPDVLAEARARIIARTQGSTIDGEVVPSPAATHLAAAAQLPSSGGGGVGEALGDAAALHSPVAQKGAES